MTCYVAARYTDKIRARVARAQLCNAGYQVTSRWLYQPVTTPWFHASRTNLQDMDRAHVGILIEPPPELQGGGGRYIEVGYMIAQGKPIVVIDPAAPNDATDGRSIFWSLPYVTVWPSLDAAMPALATLAFRLSERGVVEVG